jgi:tRNA A37 threonylcarbamoyladenosine dehydratase
MTDLYANIIHRSEMVLGPEAMKAMAAGRVIIFGLGGVGSWCAECLVRSGILDLTIVDSDIVCPTNINRQIQATSKNIGKSKADELAIRLREINPGAAVKSIHGYYDETTCGNFILSDYDYVIDAIDSLKNKILLIKNSIDAGTVIYSSMGAGARMDPSKIKTGLISATKNCPLARRVRRMLRAENISSDVVCVYSDELPVKPAVVSMCGTCGCSCSDDRESYSRETGTEAVDWCAKKKQINGALPHITAIFGFMLAGLVINDIYAGC